MSDKTPPEKAMDRDRRLLAFMRLEIIDYLGKNTDVEFVEDMIDPVFHGRRAAGFQSKQKMHGYKTIKYVKIVSEFDQVWLFVGLNTVHFSWTVGQFLGKWKEALEREGTETGLESVDNLAASMTPNLKPEKPPRSRRSGSGFRFGVDIKKVAIAKMMQYTQSMKTAPAARAVSKEFGGHPSCCSVINWFVGKR